MNHPHEYDCARCGIRVICCIPPPPETIYCATCRFIEGIEDDADRAEAAAFLDRIHGDRGAT